MENKEDETSTLKSEDDYISLAAICPSTSLDDKKKFIHGNSDTDKPSPNDLVNKNEQIKTEKSDEKEKPTSPQEKMETQESYYHKLQPPKVIGPEKEEPKTEKSHEILNKEKASRPSPTSQEDIEIKRTHERFKAEDTPPSHLPG